MTEPWSKRLSFSCDGALARYIGTSISPSGVGAGGGCRVGVNDWFEDRYTLGFRYDRSWSDAKLFPSSGVDGGSDAMAHTSWQLELGHERRNLERTKKDPSGHITFTLVKGRSSRIGRGSTESGGTAREIGGEQLTSPSASGSTWDFSTVQSFRGQWNPSKRFSVRAGPALQLKTEYEHAGSELNQVSLAVFFMVDLGFDDFVTAHDTGEQYLSTAGVITSAGMKINAMVQRALSLRTLSAQQESLNDFFGAGVTDDPARHDIRLLQGAQRMFGAFGAEGDQYFFLSSGKGWNVIPPSLQIGGTAAALADGSDAGKTAAIGDLIGLAGMGTYWAFGVATPAERNALLSSTGSTALKRKFRHAAYVRYAEPIALFAAGAIAGKSTAGKIITAGAAEGAAGVASSPDPLDRDVVSKTSFTYAPFAPYLANDGNGIGARGGVALTYDLADSPVYFETRLMSHALSVVNAGILAANATEDAQDENAIGSTGVPTEVDATIGFEKRWRYARLAAGVDTAVLDGSASAAAVGVSANASVIIKDHVLIGVTVAGHYQLQGQDFNADIIPSIGATW